jgi:ABC-2 type transport system permease protein
VYVLFRVLVKELIQLRRDKRMIPMMVVGPLVQLLVMGFSANTDVTEIPTLLVDRDRSAASRTLVDRFVGSGYFTIAGTEDGVEAIDAWLVEGHAQVAVVIDAAYGADLAAGRRPRVLVIADGTDSNSAIVGLGYAARIVAAAGAELVRTYLADLAREGAGVRAASIELVPRVWYNPDLKSRWFFVPALVAMTLMLLTMIVPSMAVVREKEIGTLEQLSVTPVRPWQLILGKLLPFAAFGFLDLFLVAWAAVLVFGVPLKGSILVLALLTIPFLFNTLGLGLLASTVARTQQQAMMGSVFLLMLPQIYLSGLIFPIENMPAVIQWGTYGIPLRYYANIVRGVFLKGSGFDVLWPDALALTVYGVLVLALASFRFRKSLD